MPLSTLRLRERIASLSRGPRGFPLRALFCRTAALLAAFAAAGSAFGATPVGSEFQVNTVTTLSQRRPNVSVKADGSYYINLGEAEEPVPLAEIGTKAGIVIAANPDIKVLVEGDKNLAYGVIVDLMNTLQAAGAKSVGLITQPPRT